MAEGRGPPKSTSEEVKFQNEKSKPNGGKWLPHFGFIHTLLKATKVAELGVYIKKQFQAPMPHHGERVDDHGLECDFAEDFVSTSQKVVNRLGNLNRIYRNTPPTEDRIRCGIDGQLEMLDNVHAFNEILIDEQLFRRAIDGLMKYLSDFQSASLFDEVQMLRTTSSQLEKQCIFISFFGAQNCGKSTLLNAILGDKFLPVKNMAETGLKVIIQNGQQLHKMTHPLDEAEHCEKCPYLCEELKGKVKQSKGVGVICKRLHKLNQKVRRKEMAEVPVCTLHVNIPALSEVPFGWATYLSDNPGFGEANEHIAQLASISVQDSSAYVYVTNSDNIGSDRDFKFFKELAAHDKESLSKGRLLIAVTKTDTASAVAVDEDEVASVAEIKSTVCHSVKEAADVSFPENEIIPVSGLWGEYANRLQCAIPDETTREFAARGLSMWPQLKLPRGQKEDDLASLRKLSPEDMVKLLEDASGIHILEQRIQNMTKGCVGIWANKIAGDCCSYLKDATAKLSGKLIDTKKLNQKLDSDLKRSGDRYDWVMEELTKLELTFTAERESPVYKAIEEAYAKDVVDSNPQAAGKKKSGELLEEFEKKCKEKIGDKQQHFGPKEFEKDVEKFLEDAAASLETTFSATFEFSAIDEEVIQKISDMTEGFTALRSNSSSLCDKENQTMTRTNTKGSTIRRREKLLKAPNLGDLREDINIPAVTLSLWQQILEWIKRKLSRGRDDMKSDSQSKEYRAWNDDLAETMQSLLEAMQKVCDTYFEEIRPHVVQHFFGRYCEIAKKRRDDFEFEFKRRLYREFIRHKLVFAVYHHTKTRENEMEKLCEHLPVLKERVMEQVEQYTSRPERLHLPVTQELDTPDEGRPDFTKSYSGCSFRHTDVSIREGLCNSLPT